MVEQLGTRRPERRARLSLNVSQELHSALKMAATRRRLSMSELAQELLASSLAVLGERLLAYEDLDDLAVRRELAAASIAALGDSWDNEIDAQWQTFQP